MYEDTLGTLNPLNPDLVQKVGVAVQRKFATFSSNSLDYACSSFSLQVAVTVSDLPADVIVGEVQAGQRTQ